MKRPADRPPTTPAATPDDRWDDDEIPRHPPVAPNDDDSAVESLGDAIADVVTGGEASQDRVDEQQAPAEPGKPAQRR